MIATLAGILFDEPAALTEPVPLKPRKHNQHRRTQYPGGPTTDIKQWLIEDGPRNYDELTDLRRALYSRRTHGQLIIKSGGHTLAGEEKFTVTGRQSPLLIVSAKSRHFLLRTLCRMLRGQGSQ